MSVDIINNAIMTYHQNQIKLLKSKLMEGKQLHIKTKLKKKKKEKKQKSYSSDSKKQCAP